jgi:hypothetical protein
MMACITPAVHGRDHREATLKLVQKYETQSVLDQLAARGSGRLTDQIQRLQDGIAHLREAKTLKPKEAEVSAVLGQNDEAQNKFLQLLLRLTELGKLEWARSEHEPGFVYCLAGEELIVFELRGGENAAPVDPEQKVAGIVSKCRNVTYLWLEGLQEWDKLLDLLKRAPTNHRAFVSMRKRSHQAPVRVLEGLL